MSRAMKFRAWISDVNEDSASKPFMFYQEDQYLGRFLRRVNMYAAGREHDSYGVGKCTLFQS